MPDTNAMTMGFYINEKGYIYRFYDADGLDCRFWIDEPDTDKIQHIVEEYKKNNEDYTIQGLIRAIIDEEYAVIDLSSDIDIEF